jgi:UDP-N-acetylmuramyl-tripeptide synthetase
VERLLAQLRKIIPAGLADRVRPAYHRALAMLGALVYRYPGRKLTVIGITGTNGKSTTANLAASVLETAGHKVGLATTVNFQVGDEKWLNDTKMTSLGRFQTQKLLRRMVDAGVTYAVLEVSSHALHWHRTYGIDFETAVFTNLTRDHLDLHKTMDGYRAAKGKLFEALKDHDGQSTAIVNGDDPNAEFFLQFYADKKYVYGQADAASEVMPLAHTVLAKQVDSTDEGSAFQVVAEDVTFNIQVNIPGRFNISNALAAASVGLAYEVPPKQIAAGIEAVTGVPGRMEHVRVGQPFAVVVDYAHTPDAFTNVLTALREQTKGRLIAVFGATGDRDQGKRPELGKVAAQLADYLILTEEDPGSEDPHRIVEQIMPGVIEGGKDHNDYEVQIKRRKAIRQALKMAKPGDTVALLAKGHETVMQYADGKYPWDDRRVATEEWNELTHS